MVTGTPKGKGVEQKNMQTVIIYIASDERNNILWSSFNNIKGEQYNSLYPGFNDGSVLMIGLKSLNPGLKTIVPFALSQRIAQP